MENALETQFWSRVQKVGPDECWIWMKMKGGATPEDHYGVFKMDGSPAHRMV